MFPAAEELLQALNAVIEKYQLHPSVVLSLLSRCSATYIRKVQQYYDEQNVDVEEGFNYLLNTDLVNLEMQEFKTEIERVNLERSLDGANWGFG